MSAQSASGSLYRRLRVAAIVDETHDAKSVVFDWPEDAAERARFAYRPGQFLTLRIPHAEGSIARCYSLCSSPQTDAAMKITVKRVTDGRGSNWVCDWLKAGDELEVLPPGGVFTPRSLDEDLLLFAGGSGITPVMSILKTVLAGGRGRVALIYANRDERSVIFRDALRELSAAYPSRLSVVHWLESVQGLPSIAQLAELARPHAGAQVFVCGPGPFMDAAAAALSALGVDRGGVHIEKFVSLEADPGLVAPVEIPAPDADSAQWPQAEVQLDGQTHHMAWPRETVLLDLLIARGLEPPFSCREGRCSACMCKLRSGDVALRHNEVLDRRDVDEGWILACQALPRSEHIQISFDDQ